MQPKWLTHASLNIKIYLTETRKFKNVQVRFTNTVTVITPAIEDTRYPYRI